MTDQPPQKTFLYSQILQQVTPKTLKNLGIKRFPAGTKYKISNHRFCTVYKISGKFYTRI